MSEDDVPENPGRREFLGRLATGAAAVTVAGAVPLGLVSCSQETNKPFNLEREIASGTLDKTTSEAYGEKHEPIYRSLKAAIDQGSHNQLNAICSQEWARRPGAEERAVLAKALAYILASAAPQKDDLAKAILKSAPASRDVRFITLGENPKSGMDAVVKSLSELARDGYRVDVPANRARSVIDPDYRLASNIQGYIDQLSPPASGQGR